MLFRSEICTQYNVHLIADEIAVGFGRTGSMFASYNECNGACSFESCCQNRDCRPDFMCLSKGITGGYLPLSCVLTRDEIFQAFYDDEISKGFLHSHSYTGNPLACSAALATLAIFESDNVIKANKIKAAYITTKMQALTGLPIQHFRMQGMIWAFDVITKNPNFTRDSYVAALSNGLLIRPIGNTVYFMPPYTITETEIDFMIAATVKVLQKVL